MSEKQALKQGLLITAALGEAIREAGEIPSGHLYAVVMGRMGLEMYETAIQMLVKGGLVRNNNHLLTWIGPKKGGS